MACERNIASNLNLLYLELRFKHWEWLPDHKPLSNRSSPNMGGELAFVKVRRGELLLWVRYHSSRLLGHVLMDQNQNELYCQVCLEFVFVTEATAVQQNDRDRTKKT